MLAALIETTDYQLTWTHPIEAKIVKPFSSYHRLIEYQSEEDENVSAMASGVVTFFGQSKKYGNSIIVEHKDGYVGAYINIKDYFVTLGDNVEAGATIGTTNKKNFTFKLNHYTELLDFNEIKQKIEKVIVLSKDQRANMVFQAQQQVINEEMIVQQKTYEKELVEVDLTTQKLSQDRKKVTKNIVTTKADKVLQTTKYQLTWVNPVDAIVSIPFSSYYRSVEYQTKKNQEIRSIAKGIVRFTGDSKYGSLVSIEHKEGYVGAYFNIENFKVKVGDSVKAGSIIGTVAEQKFKFKLRHYTEFVSFERVKNRIEIVKKIPELERIRIVKRDKLQKQLEKKLAQSKLEREQKLQEIVKLQAQEKLKLEKVAYDYRISRQKEFNKKKNIQVEDSQYTWVNPVSSDVLKAFSSYHRSVEYDTVSGENIKSIAKGIVTYVGYSKKYGQSISIMHDDGYTGAYTQLGEIKVKNGDNVKIGMTIGITGQQPFDFKLRYYTDFVDFVNLKNKAQVAMVPVGKVNFN